MMTCHFEVKLVHHWEWISRQTASHAEIIAKPSFISSQFDVFSFSEKKLNKWTHFSGICAMSFVDHKTTMNDTYNLKAVIVPYDSLMKSLQKTQE